MTVGRLRVTRHPQLVPTPPTRERDVSMCCADGRDPGDRAARQQPRPQGSPENPGCLIRRCRAVGLYQDRLNMLAEPGWTRSALRPVRCTGPQGPPLSWGSPCPGPGHLQEAGGSGGSTRLWCGRVRAPGRPAQRGGSPRCSDAPGSAGAVGAGAWEPSAQREDTPGRARVRGVLGAFGSRPGWLIGGGRETTRDLSAGKRLHPLLF